MDIHTLTQSDADAGPRLGASRARVLGALQAAGTSLTVSEAAQHVGLHLNTTRLHLDALVEDELVDRDVEDRRKPGRPRILYTARPSGTRPGRSSYRLLAEILTSYLAAETPQPDQAAQHAGHAWGRYFADRPPPFRHVDAAAATEQLVGALDTIGFSPEEVTGGDEQQVRLHHCPFREAAEEHREVVCSVHLGLMQGFLAELNAPINAERLDPFVEPNLCIAHLRSRPGPQRSSSLAEH